ncbi:MAG: hypothetical protein U9R17_03650 [Thermodesulfobacteriota bacterium]|nr:hypothetical protein [Thermodesulfobacteriota bacterium]
MSRKATDTREAAENKLATDTRRQTQTGTENIFSFSPQGTESAEIDDFPFAS